MTRVYLETYGCSANKADTERILGILLALGVEKTDDPKESDVIILNTCAVKLTTENRMISRYKALARYGKPIIVGGCLPRMNWDRFEKECGGFAAAIDPNSLGDLPSIFERVLQGKRGIVDFSEPDQNLFSLPHCDLKPVIHIIPISFGCLGKCAFCGVRNVRRGLVSVPEDTIVSDFLKALKSGKKEFWITSQDTGIYGIDIGKDLVSLLERILEIPGGYRVRIGMMNPFGAKRILNGLLKIFKDDRVYKFAHIPVQSGSDSVLQRMNRQHTVEDFEAVVDKLRRIPDITIATDIIVGFPGETDDDFERTLSLLKRTRPDIVNVSKFYPRPGTPASSMEKIPTSVISERTRRLARLVDRLSLESNEKMVGREFDVLISDERGNAMIGRTPNYKQVILSRKDAKLGDFKKVLITKAGRHSLFGR